MTSPEHRRSNEGFGASEKTREQKGFGVGDEPLVLDPVSGGKEKLSAASNFTFKFSILYLNGPPPRSRMI